MVHGYAVADAYGVELKRHATPSANSRFHSLGNAAQMNMAGHDLVETVGYTNERLGKVIAANANSPEQCPMWCPLNAFLHTIATHRLQKMPPWLK
jgi:hypothetical protein